MASLAYRDFTTRLVEPRALIRAALETTEAVQALAFTKGAAVLAAAALERYINDVVNELSRACQVATWGELTEGQQRYFAHQISRLLYLVSGSIYRRGENTPKRRARLDKIVHDCVAALGSPRSWNYSHQYGMFMEGAAEAGRVDSTLRLFDGSGRSIFDFVGTRGKDQGAMARALGSLISARHQAAHALSGTTPGPADVRLWIVQSYVLVREIECYLGYR